MPQRSIILAAGGTGGHIFPAQAIAESLLSRGWKVALITDQRGNGFTAKIPNKVHKKVLNIPNPRGKGNFRLFRFIWFMTKSLIIILKFCLKSKPEVVVGFGGYPSVTGILVARLLRISTAIHEQNAILGTVNQIFQKNADLLVFGVSPQKEPNCKGRVKVLGNPLRLSVSDLRPCEYSSLPSDRYFIFVVGGSQGANFVSSMACDAILDLPLLIREKITVLHQCREESIPSIEAKYADKNVKAEIRSFFYDISTCLNKANLIISRSGASSIAEFCFFGRPSILIPLPSAVYDHQTLNATVMQDAGASIVLDQNSLDSNFLTTKINYILANFQVAHNMAISAKKLSRPDAASRFVAELENLSHKRVK